MTRIMIITIGTRGDIQPFVALGKRLMSEGYDVALQTADHFKPMVEEAGLPYLYMNNDFIALTESKEGQAAIDGGGKLALMKTVMPLLASMLQDEWAAVQAFSPDLIVYHPKSLGGYHFAEKLGIPQFKALALPLYTPTKAYPSPILPGLRLGGAFNRATYKMMDFAFAPYMGVINDFREKTLGLPRRGRFASEGKDATGSPVPILYCYSAHVLPVPNDYPPEAHVTGYWHLDRQEAWQPSSELEAFLAAGAPPVYIGFGSMAGTHAENRTKAVLAALAQSGQRGLLASGWGGLKERTLPETVFMLDQAPHDWLFPRVAAVVHHGGAGTTAAGLRAGKPTIIVPFVADQPFWGRIVHELGAGPAPIPQKRLTAETLSQAIGIAVGDADMQRKAAEIGAKLRAEDGTGNAVEVIRRTLG